jgi:membrane protein implicated in regulation of membrane protease activity
VERQQLRWVAASLVLVAAAVTLGVFTSVWLPAEIAFPMVPVAVAIAVLRYRLYEIDRIISRTIAYASLTGILVVVFAGAILVFQAVLAPLTNGNTVAVAASTLIVAALFQPIRRPLQEKVDRRFNRARYDADRTLASFAGALREDVDLQRLGTDIRSTVDQTVQPTFVSLWLRR